MIVTELYNGQGLGNQLFCYVTTRAIALDSRFKFGIKSPEKFKGKDFLDLDFGEPVTGGIGPEGGPPKTLPDGITNYYVEKKLIHPKNKADIRSYDSNLIGVPDNTKIDGLMQGEQYFQRHKEKIKKWLTIKREYNFQEFSKENICIINFRGGEYVPNNNLLLRQKYWDDAVANMRNVNPKMKFVVVTDDVATARKFFPKFSVNHWNIGKDYAVIQNAFYLILSNSSFAWFPAWLNKKVKLCIAPKYWARHNVSDGYWCLGYNITDGWLYQDRDGKLEDYKTCLTGLRKYISAHPAYYPRPPKKPNYHFAPHIPILVKLKNKFLSP